MNIFKISSLSFTLAELSNFLNIVYFTFFSSIKINIVMEQHIKYSTLEYGPVLVYVFKIDFYSKKQ